CRYRLLRSLPCEAESSPALLWRELRFCSRRVALRRGRTAQEAGIWWLRSDQSIGSSVPCLLATSCLVRHTASFEEEWVVGRVDQRCPRCELYDGIQQRRPLAVGDEYLLVSLHSPLGLSASLPEAPAD